MLLHGVYFLLENVTGHNLTVEHRNDTIVRYGLPRR